MWVDLYESSICINVMAIIDISIMLCYGVERYLPLLNIAYVMYWLIWNMEPNTYGPDNALTHNNRSISVHIVFVWLSLSMYGYVVYYVWHPGVKYIFLMHPIWILEWSFNQSNLFTEMFSFRSLSGNYELCLWKIHIEYKLH